MRRTALLRALTVLGVALALAAATPVAAKAPPAAKAPAAVKKKARGGGGAKEKPTARAQPKDPPLPAPQGKVVVFTFAGEGAHIVQQRVIGSLRAKGLKVLTNLRPVDSAEQYREMAATLNLVAYVDGEYDGEGDQASATVYLRSGVTGLRSASTTFAGERRTLAAEVGKGLWDRLSPDLSRLCVDAAKPRKVERAPLRIEAGTPLENHPAGDGSPQ